MSVISTTAGARFARPRRGARRALTGAIITALLFATAPAAYACPPPLNPPGQMVDIGGRRMQIVCDGPKAAATPTVLFESGAFGFSADWAVVQARLTAMGLRSCAYDRAGMGFSDAAPGPRDSDAVVGDLEKLLAASGETGPFVLVGHSMAGLHLRLFADRNPGRVVGLVLVDATTPEALDDAANRQDVADFTRGAHAAEIAATLGVTKLLRWTHAANKIGLTGEAEAEKRHMFGSGRYNRAAAAEVVNWPLDAQEARSSGRYDPQWPVAVITSGKAPGPLKAVQRPPAEASRHGYVEVVADASHDRLLGPVFCDAIVRGVDFVIEEAGKPAQPLIVAPSNP
jgi:pimeloyl-ACP methyl ester carboxylesterase